MYTLNECHRHTLCIDCDSKTCQRSRDDKGNDCPKWICDNVVLQDCDNCAFIDEYIQVMRKQYRAER
jgi:hypothetical protein